MNILNSLRDIVSSKYVSNADYIRKSYSRSMNSVIEDNLPDFVVRPENSEEISEIVKIAYSERIPIIPRGGGAGLQQGAIPYKPGGIVIDTTRMNKILNLDEDHLTVRVQCGITWAELNTFLMEKGYYTGNVGPNSGMSAVVGGGLSNNSYGEGIAIYGPVTKNCIGLKVVLPNKNGDIIETGSGECKYVKNPFNRFGFVSDLLGIFLGDNGIMGIKTEAILKIYSKPKFKAHMSFTLKRKSAEVALKILFNCRKKGYLGIFRAGFVDSSLVRASMIKILPDIPPLDENLKIINPKGRSMLEYILIGENENIIEENNKIIEEISLAEKGVESIDAQKKIFKWDNDKNEYWQVSHHIWGALGPESTGQSAECRIAMHNYPELTKGLSKWTLENSEKLQAVKAFPATGGMISLCDHTTISFPIGLIVWNKPEYRKLNGELWDSFMDAAIKLGVMPYMTGLRYSRSLIRTGAFSEQFLNFLRTIKQSLDPRGILSPGKYNLGMYSE